MRRALLLGLALLSTACAARAPRPRVILVSIDGLWAGDLARAESAGVPLPTFDSLRRAGQTADGVLGQFPSVTYPSHTTMVTGVPPAVHGVFANRLFQPPSDVAELSFRDAGEVRVPTLFDAAHAAGLKVGAVFWPVSARDSSIDWNIPDAWDQTNRQTQLAALRWLGTSWLLDTLHAPAAGEPGDSLRVRWAIDIIRRWNPDLMALHVLDLDGAKHDNGIWNDSVVRVLRTIDHQLSQLFAAVRQTGSDRRTTVILTSDHGFLGYRQQLRPGVLLVNAGLVRLDSAGPARSWDAGVLANGGSAMLIPRDSTDTTMARRIRAAIPDSLVGPGRPIRAILPHDTIAVLGGDPRALWALDMNEGFYAVAGYREPLLRDRLGGGHGHDPRRPELNAFFLVSGPGIGGGTRRGLMRQTEIAGIIAKVLGLRGF